MNKEILDFLKMNDVEHRENFELYKISPIRIGTRALIVLFPDSVDKLINTVDFLENANIKYKITGRMSNILPPDEKYMGAVIRTDRIRQFKINENILYASCGVALPYIASVLQKAGLSGFEGLSGIPGSVGGAVVGNAGAFGREIADTLVGMLVYDISQKTVSYISADKCEFSYRYSTLQNSNMILLSCEFSLCRSDSLNVLTEMERCLNLRRNSQPTDKPSLGSCFKRPSGNFSAAWYIDRCGLKGYKIGGAEISPKHAGFIVNEGGAIAKDYIELSDYAAMCVRQKYGVHLVREVEIM